MNAPNALDARQADALTELLNIAYGLTASKLSEISGARVQIDAPIVGIFPLQDLAAELGLLEAGDVAAVHQAFTGSISGDAMLFLDYEGAVRLSNVFVEEGLRSDRLDSNTGEVVTEIGNMLLGACLGVFGNLLEMRISFSVPALHLDSMKPLLTSLSIVGDELRHAIVISTSFDIRKQGVAGQLSIALGASSLERLIQAVGVWEGSQCRA
jgi:chemotaxis protein CheC